MSYKAVCDYDGEYGQLETGDSIELVRQDAWLSLREPLSATVQSVYRLLPGFLLSTASVHLTG